MIGFQSHRRLLLRAAGLQVRGMASDNFGAFPHSLLQLGDDMCSL
jgi:hypothetical protein